MKQHDKTLYNNLAFKEKRLTPRAKKDRERKPPIYGIGILDNNYAVYYTDEDGQRLSCMFYNQWMQILDLCYNNHNHETALPSSTFTMDPRWHRFSVFKKWMEKEELRIATSNKTLHAIGGFYSPKTCYFE